MAKFTDRVALITGAGRGMGRSHAECMARAGAAVIIVQDIDAELARASAEIVREQGGQAYEIVCDVSDIFTLNREIAAAEQALGRIDILINNAGIDTPPGELEAIDEERFTRMFDIHVKGSFFATQAVIPGMKQRRYGKIVNISSMWGMTGHSSHSHYCGAKAALLGFTKAWAKELAPYNINVNAVAPGGVITEMVLQKGGMEYVEQQARRIPLQRYAETVEISHSVLFLASGEADFITGQVISPNGGEVIVGI